MKGKNHIYSRCIDCGFKKFETIDNKKLNDILKSLKLYIGQCYRNVWSAVKMQKAKTQGWQRQIKKN